MALEVPNEIKRGDPILADFLNGLVRATRANRIMPGVGILTAQNSGGTTVSAMFSGSSSSEYPPFFTYVSSATEVIVNAGQVIFPTNEIIVVVATSSALTVANNDKVWLERTGALTWVAAVGAAYPTASGKIHIPLATVVIASSVITLTYQWNGGDIVLPEVFPVVLSAPAGAVGSISADSARTYTVKTLGTSAIDLFGASTLPANVRTAKCEYVDGTKGLAWFKADGTFDYIAINEVVKGDVVDIVSSVTWNGTILVQNTRKYTVLESNTTDVPTTIDTPEESDVTPCA